MTLHDPFLMARLGLAVSESLAPLEGGGHVVLITSATPFADESVAELLAQELASKLDGDVALVDLREQAPAGARNNAGGMAALMTGSEIKAGEAKADAGGVFRLFAGKAARADMLFQAAALSTALSALRTRFQLTVIAGPALQECGALVQQSDKVLLVIDARATSPRVVRRAMAQARVEGTDIDGAILANAQENLPSWLAAA